MDRMRYKGNERGVATVLVVGVLVFFLLFFFVLAIDFAYVYTARGQLQNAADAAALAGADLLTPNQFDTLQTLARNEAILFASKNYVAGEAVDLLDEDIEFGHWDGNTFTPGTPVNAIQVTAKRLEGRGNPVSLYFGWFMGWPTMDIIRVAVASRPARANVPILICVDACDSPLGSGSIINSSGTKFYWATPFDDDITDPSIQQIAFTAFTDESSVNTGDIIPFFCGNVFDSCATTITTTNAVNAATILQFRCAFLNPLYDSAHKTCENSLGVPKPCDLSSDKVTSWTVLSPLTEECPPSDQGGNVEPYTITGYAEIKVIDVHAAGPPTTAKSANNCSCSILPPGVWVEPTIGFKAVIINGIHCVDCEDPDIDELTGRKPFLVK